MKCWNVMINNYAIQVFTNFNVTVAVLHHNSGPGVSCQCKGQITSTDRDVKYWQRCDIFNCHLYRCVVNDPNYIMEFATYLGIGLSFIIDPLAQLWFLLYKLWLEWHSYLIHPTIPAAVTIDHVDVCFSHTGHAHKADCPEYHSFVAVYSSCSWH